MNTNSQYEITVTYNGVDVNYSANESFDLVILDDQTSSATNQTVIGSYSNITMQGTFAGPPNLFDLAYVNTETFTPSSNGVYYLGIHVNSPAGGDVFFVKEIEIIEQTLSTQDFEALNFNYFVDAQNNLNLSANQAFDQIKLHNLLGQQVLNQKLSAQDERIDLNALTSGVYLAQVQINDATKTFKIIKK
ncbi:T9SS type A sorting domain-containing protein [Flavobacterium sp. CS20]|uniref:T9SS type A sorting domain-containing protein n=1 Tax=Flavobacterium sp. CS20 TaxID=2775246 RepID=UPI001B39E18D|nr:T9SS type A sorting domain-containing protein [Flavobacterium sp. CS20]QTY26296.1 T9SS type A sorting domain-containing protein [Flavobacterium sp. CS20]